MSEKILLSLREALVYAQKRERVQQGPRPFAALSFKASTSGRYTVNGRVVEHAPGALCLVPAGVGYRRESEREDIFVLHFDTSVVLPPEIRVLQVEDIEGYRQKFALAHSLWQQREAGYYYRVSAILYELFADVIAPVEQAEWQGDYLAEAARYMEKHFGNSALSIGQLAARAFVSPANLRRRFGARYGCSPKQYLNRLRMEYARSLLCTAYFTTEEIAARCGFSDVAYFRTAFCRYFGESISTARRKWQAT